MYAAQLHEDRVAFILLELVERRETAEVTDRDGDTSVAYRISERGQDWLPDNQDRLVLRFDPPQRSKSDDVPF